MRRPTAISLYTGAGGLDYGFEAAGFRTAIAIDVNPSACAAIRANRPEWPVIERDIHTVSSAEIQETAGLEPREADVLIAGPPCQPFSKASFWSRTGNRRLDDPRADTLLACLRILGDLQPRAFLLENVQGLVHRGKDEGMRRLLGGIADLNRRTGTRYENTWRVLDAADYGAPQHRKRVFLVGSRDGRRFAFPDATHGPTDTANALENAKRVPDVLGRNRRHHRDGAGQPRAGRGRQVGRPPAVNTRGTELPVAHAPGRRPQPLRLADAVLELPAQAGEEPASMDDPGPTGDGRRPVPLVEPQADNERTRQASDIPGRRTLRLQTPQQHRN